MPFFHSIHQQVLFHSILKIYQNLTLPTTWMLTTISNSEVLNVVPGFPASSLVFSVDSSHTTTRVGLFKIHINQIISLLFSQNSNDSVSHIEYNPDSVPWPSWFYLCLPLWACLLYSDSLTQLHYVYLRAYRHTGFIPTSELLPVSLSPQTFQWFTRSLCSFLGPNITYSEKYLWLLSLKQICQSSSSFFAFSLKVLLPEIHVFYSSLIVHVSTKT